MNTSVGISSTATPLHAISHQLPRSILEDRQARAQVGGRIRPGIKVLTSTAKQHPDAQGIYDAMVAAGQPYDVIEKRLFDKCKFTKSPLTPKNVPFFRVSPCDFGMPEVADRILSLFGEDRGNGHGRQLYRLPIILHSDDALENLPNGLHAYAASSLRYWSKYAGDGVRYCMKYRPAEVDERNRRAARQWGGRKEMVNTEFNACGRCDPEACPVYQKKECALTGSLLFYIPGVPGGSLIQMETGSIYSLMQMVDAMNTVSKVRNGRMSGLYNGLPVFYLTKVQKEISRIENGVPKRVMQFLPNLEVDLNMVDVFNQRDALPAIAAQPQRQALSAPAPEVVATVDEPKATKSKHPPEIAAQRRTLFAKIGALKVNEAQFILTATALYGEHFGASLDALTTLNEVLDGAAAHPDEFKAWLDNCPF